MVNDIGIQEWDELGEVEGLDDLEDWEQEAFELEADPFWPAVHRVMAVASRGAAPLFRVVGKALSNPRAARSAARRLPGVFVRGSSQQVRTFARSVGGQLVGPERHGAGLPHYHLIRPNGDRVHVWYGKRVPQGDFFE